MATTTPVVILRKKRSSPMTPTVQPVPAQVTPKPQKNAPIAQTKPQKGEVKATPTPAKPTPAKPPQQTLHPSGLNKRQRQNIKRRERFLHSPEFIAISTAMVTRWPHIFRVTSDTIRPLAI